VPRSLAATRLERVIAERGDRSSSVGKPPRFWMPV